MSKISCRYCGVRRSAAPGPCWGCGEHDESFLNALVRHFPRLAVIAGSVRRLLGAGT